MATLTIEGRKVKVDDAFLQMSPQEQQSAVEEIASQIGIGSNSAASAQTADRWGDLPYPGNPNFNPGALRPETYAESYPSQALSGVNEGIAGLVGLPVDAATMAINAGLSGLNTAFPAEPTLSGLTTGEQPSPRFPYIEKPPLGSDMLKETMASGGAIAPPTNDPMKQAVRRMGEEVGTAAIPIGSTAAHASKPIIAAAKELGLVLGSGAGAAAAEHIAPDNPLAELVGQVAGTLGAGGIMRAGKAAITPFQASPARLAAAQTMADEGVMLTAGQKTGSKGLQYAESELGGRSIGDITEKQAEQFTSAALRRAGVSADRASPEVMDAAFTSIGQQFDDLATRSQLPLDRQLGSDLGAVVHDYRALVPESQRAPVVENIVVDLINATQGGPTVAGPAYQALRSRLDRLARGAAKDTQLSDALFGIRNALDDSVERYLSQTNPDALGQWRQVRGDYRNMLVLERAAQGAGESAAMGIISPAALRTAAQGIYGRRSYVRGTDPFSELAQAGQATMTPLPQSGTAPRTAVRSLGVGIPGVVGALMGEKAMPGAGALVGLAAGAAVPSAVGKAILSGPGRRYLANQALTGPASGSTGISPIVAALVAQQQNAPPRIPSKYAKVAEALRLQGL